MTSITQGEHAGANRAADIASKRLLWLVIGTTISLFAADARLDIPLAAWIAPIFLLRFTRTGGLAGAIGGIVAATALQIVVLLIEYAAPFNTTAIAICPTLGVLFSLPYIADRLFAARLGALGRILLMPVAAGAVEFAAANILPVGASIGTRAITQTENLALIQIVSALGPYVIGFLIALAATVANRIWENPTRNTLIAYGGSFAAMLIAVVGFGEARLTYAANAAPGATVRIAGVVPQMALRASAWTHVSMTTYPPSAQTRAAVATPQMKAKYSKVQDELLAQTRAAAKSGAKIILWSETAAPVLEADKAALLQKVSGIARENKVYVNAAIGVPYERNETYLIGPDGHQDWHYRKNHPVPGMEPVAPFSNAPPVATTPYGRLSNVICYDADFPSLMRVRADIMLLPGWDWPEAAYIHTMRMARLRAIENGYSLVRNDYNGLSAAFDPYGRVLAMQNTLQGLPYTMTVDVPTEGVTTLYNRTGDLFAWLCVLMTLGLCVSGILPPRSARPA